MLRAMAMSVVPLMMARPSGNTVSSKRVEHRSQSELADSYLRQILQPGC